MVSYVMTDTALTFLATLLLSLEVLASDGLLAGSRTDSDDSDYEERSPARKNDTVGRSCKRQRRSARRPTSHSYVSHPYGRRKTPMVIDRQQTSYNVSRGQRKVIPHRA